MIYLNSVLGLFDLAGNYRKYQISLVKNFIKNTILEVGPGRGEIISHFAHDKKKKISLLEPDSENFEFLKKKFEKNPNVKVSNLFIADVQEKFETIIYMDVVEHIENHEEEILKAYSKLEKNGYLIFIVPAFQLLFSDFDRAVGHYRRYEKKFFKEFAKSNNIKCVKNHYFDSLGFFIVLIGKILKLKNNKTVSIGIKFWNLLIIFSRINDTLIFNAFGKSLICVYKKD